jgi:hypothetical protein
MAMRVRSLSRGLTQADHLSVMVPMSEFILRGVQRQSCLFLAWPGTRHDPHPYASFFALCAGERSERHLSLLRRDQKEVFRQPKRADQQPTKKIHPPVLTSRDLEHMPLLACICGSQPQQPPCCSNSLSVEVGPAAGPPSPSCHPCGCSCHVTQTLKSSPMVAETPSARHSPFHQRALALIVG